MSLKAAARLGALSNGADIAKVDADAIAAIVEDVCSAIEAGAAELREVMRGALVSGRHPSWFEGELCVKDWRSSLFDAFMMRVKYQEPIERPRLQLVQGGAR